MKGDDRTLSVAMLCPGWPAEGMVNGIVTYVNQVTRGLEQVGVRCTILAQQVTGPSGDRNVINLRVGDRPAAISMRILNRLRRYRTTPRQWWDTEVTSRIVDSVLRLRTQRQVDLLEMEESFGWIRQVQPRIKVPVVLRAHGPWFITGASLASDRDAEFEQRVEAEGAGFTLADGVSCPSANLLARIRQQYEIELSDAVVIPNAIAPVPQELRWSAAEAARAPRTILFVGRFDKLKGGDVMVRAFGALARQRPDCRLCFVGPDQGVRDEQGKLISLPEFVRQAVDPAGRDRIDITGPLDPSRIALLRRNASVVVIASRYENFPMTCLEAMASGCPIVASRVGGLPEIIEHGRNGLLFTSGDDIDLARQIAVMLDHPGRAAEMAAQAASDCAAKYDPVVVASQTKEFYLRVRERWESRKGSARRLSRRGRLSSAVEVER